MFESLRLTDHVSTVPAIIELDEHIYFSSVKDIKSASANQSHKFNDVKALRGSRKQTLFQIQVVPLFRTSIIPNQRTKRLKVYRSLKLHRNKIISQRLTTEFSEAKTPPITPALFTCAFFFSHFSIRYN